MKPVIKAVALDKDGVIFDTERLIYRAFRELIVRERLPIRPELFEELVGKPPQVYLQVLNEALGQAMSLDDFIARWFALRDEIFADEGAPFMPGADALIAALHARGVPLALVTGDFRRNVERDFARSSRPELFACFAHVITYEDVANPKPDPEPYRRAAEALGVESAGGRGLAAGRGSRDHGRLSYPDSAGLRYDKPRFGGARLAHHPPPR